MTRTEGLYWWTSGMRDDLKVQKPLCGIVLLYKEKEWKTTTGTRLSTNQWMDHQKLIPLTTYSPTDRQNWWCWTNHSGWHLLGVQHHINNRQRPTQSSLCDKSGTLQTNSNVLWTHQLTCNIPDHDGHNIPQTDHARNPHSVYGQHSNTHQKKSR